MAAWPALGNRPFTASHLLIDDFEQTWRPTEVAELFDRHGLTLSSLAYYDNNLHPDPDEREADQRARRCVHRRRGAARLPHRRHVHRP